jgi:hypothetical protein
MNRAIFVVVPLAPLFASLLAGSTGCTSCFGFKSEERTETVELTPAEYAEWQAGGNTTDPTGGATGTGTGGGMMLDDEEICAMICEQAVPFGFSSCSVGDQNAQGKIPVDCVYNTVCEGRRHACVTSRVEAAGSAAAWLVRAAHDEAASVHAFVALARELQAHGAPQELLAWVEAARRDEERHAEVVGRLARAYGGEPAEPVIEAVPVRELLAIAVENAVEGCVGETWAALMAAHQARAAAVGVVREVYAGIAVDEARHAELAWALDAWLMRQLNAGERAMVAAARAAAVRRLAAVLADSSDEPALLALGVPGRARAQELVAGLDAALWSRVA